ncbi:hypothetical protein NEFER03_2221 [Nematocida sp. LUAm3]|nr:hypothetical protein NEFER03_2221 [Nematocida sp. LUAm3]KAI5176355.1 hypothetical protein NEFER02_2133 [Nematocida sp. LUAm2]KAI5179371.1 hypothetical protein NEFER01_2207 [Nematocida sp. LUAm1]
MSGAQKNKCLEERAWADVKRKIEEKSKKGGIVLVVGETGCGKSTSIPKMLYEVFGGVVVVTQPRRVAAVSLARRVSSISPELGENGVGYAIRFEDTCRKDTKIKYVTDGILLKWISGKCKLETVVVDEVHERSIRTDVLLGLLKRQVQETRVVLMSATADVQRITEYFTKDKIEVDLLEIPGRIHPVQCKYLPKPASDYIEAAYSAIRMIVKDTKSSKETKESATPIEEGTNPIDDIFGSSTKTQQNAQQNTQHGNASRNTPYGNVQRNAQYDNVRGSERVSERVTGDVRGGSILVFLSGMEDINELFNMISFLSGVEVMKMHSSLDGQEQKKIFSRREKRFRVILSTNIAETSITIPDVRWVIDTGVEKINIVREGVEMLGIVTISSSSADQRMGRAGRTGPGVCYRLYTEEAYKKMKKYNEPEILRTEISSLSLSLASMKIDPVSFDYPEHPGENRIFSSLRELFLLQLIDRSKNITELGNSISKLPLSSILGKFLYLGCSFGVPGCVAGICAILSSFSSFVLPSGSDASSYVTEESIEYSSDLTLSLSILFSFINTPKERRKIFSSSLNISLRELSTAEKVFNQLIFLIKKHMKKTVNWKEEVSPDIPKHGKYPLIVIPKKIAEKIHLSASSAFITRIAESQENGAYLHLYSKKTLWIHPSSLLFRKKEKAIGFILSSLTTKNYVTHVFPYIHPMR